MYILGINAYHGGASACLIKDGALIAAVEEERFTRVKYWAGFPVHSINYCLSEAGISPYDLGHIGISRDPRANLIRKAVFAIRQLPRPQFLLDRTRNLRRVGSLRRVFCSLMSVDSDVLEAEFYNIEHHCAHLASAFFVSPFERAAVLSVDGMGDFSSTMWGVGSGNDLEVHGSINFPHSIGIVYTAVSQWLGFQNYGDEGKVMGLAPYGTPTYADKLLKMVRIHTDGTFDIDQSFLRYKAEGGTMTWTGGAPSLERLYSNYFVSVFGEPRDVNGAITQYHKDMAASLQLVIEEAEFALVRKLHSETGHTALCMAGGVALNSVFNGKVLPNTGFTDIYVQPAASDSGTALGVCYYIYNQIMGQPRNFEMNSAYTGPRFDNGIVQSVLEQRSLSYKTFTFSELSRNVAEMVADGKVVGWFHGRMEWGPRALGHRSIIADPRRADIKDTLNARIKHRESFRPFAPSVLLEDVDHYFDQSYPDPFMLKVYNVLPEKWSEIPSVTHVDGSGRLQTVDRVHSPIYWELINAFRDHTGVPVVLNTSFNENEPIVCTPEEAVSCFMRTRMDALAINNYLVTK